MNRPLRVVVGSDDAGFDYKNVILADLDGDSRVTSVEDLGVFKGDLDALSYSEIGLVAGEWVASGRADRAVLVCGTGMGLAIAANKVPGVRATVAHDSYSVERSILSNDCQVLTLGQRVIGLELARRLVKEWLGYEFDPATPSNDKVAIIAAYELNAPTPPDSR